MKVEGFGDHEYELLCSEMPLQVRLARRKKTSPFASWVVCEASQRSAVSNSNVAQPVHASWRVQCNETHEGVALVETDTQVGVTVLFVSKDDEVAMATSPCFSAG